MSYLDTINMDNPLKLYNSLEIKPDVLMVHRGIDEETFNKNRLNIDNVDDAKNNEDADNDKKLILGVAGGVSLDNIDELKTKYDILVVGRGITKSRDPGRVARAIVNKLGDDIEQYRLYLDEDEDIGCK